MFSNMRVRANQLAEAKKAHVTCTEKFARCADVWMNYLTFLYGPGDDVNEAREIAAKALSVLDKKAQVLLIQKAASLEYLFSLIFPMLWSACARLLFSKIILIGEPEGFFCRPRLSGASFRRFSFFPLYLTHFFSGSNSRMKRGGKFSFSSFSQPTRSAQTFGPCISMFASSGIR